MRPVVRWTRSVYYRAAAGRSLAPLHDPRGFVPGGGRLWDGEQEPRDYWRLGRVGAQPKPNAPHTPPPRSRGTIRRGRCRLSRPRGSRPTAAMSLRFSPPSRPWSKAQLVPLGPTTDGQPLPPTGVQAAGAPPPVERPDGQARIGALEVLVMHHYATVYDLALRTLGRREDAEDVAQGTFLRALSHLGALREPAAARAWLCRIAANLCVDELRQRQRASGRRRDSRASATASVGETGTTQTTPVDAGGEPVGVTAPGEWGAEASILPLNDVPDPDRLSTPAAAVELRELRLRVWQATLALPPAQRLALALRELHAMTYAEIAAALDTSVPAVETLLFRSRQAFRRAFMALPGQTDGMGQIAAGAATAGSPDTPQRVGRSRPRDLPSGSDLSCHWVLSRLSASVDGELSRAEARSVTAHVARCPSCRFASRELRATRRLYALAPLTPLPHPSAIGLLSRLKPAAAQALPASLETPVPAIASPSAAVGGGAVPSTHGALAVLRGWLPDVHGVQYVADRVLHGPGSALSELAAASPGAGPLARATLGAAAAVIVSLAAAPLGDAVREGGPPVPANPAAASGLAPDWMAAAPGPPRHSAGDHMPGATPSALPAVAATAAGGLQSTGASAGLATGTVTSTPLPGAAGDTPSGAAHQRDDSPPAEPAPQPALDARNAGSSPLTVEGRVAQAGGAAVEGSVRAPVPPAPPADPVSADTAAERGPTTARGSRIGGDRRLPPLAAGPTATANGVAARPAAAPDRAPDPASAPDPNPVASSASPGRGPEADRVGDGPRPVHAASDQAEQEDEPWHDPHGVTPEAGPPIEAGPQAAVHSRDGAPDSGRAPWRDATAAVPGAGLPLPAAGVAALERRAAPAAPEGVHATPPTGASSPATARPAAAVAGAGQPPPIATARPLDLPPLASQPGAGPAASTASPVAARQAGPSTSPATAPATPPAAGAVTSLASGTGAPMPATPKPAGSPPATPSGPAPSGASPSAAGASNAVRSAAAPPPTGPPTPLAGAPTAAAPATAAPAPRSAQSPVPTSVLPAAASGKP